MEDAGVGAAEGPSSARCDVVMIICDECDGDCNRRLTESNPPVCAVDSGVVTPV